MKYHKQNGVTGNPANAVLFFFDREVPLWFRLLMFLLGCLTWGTLIVSLMEKS